MNFSTTFKFIEMHLYIHFRSNVAWYIKTIEQLWQTFFTGFKLNVQVLKELILLLGMEMMHWSNVAEKNNCNVTIDFYFK